VHQLTAAYSTPALDSLARLVAEDYGLKHPEVVLLRRGFNDNYRVTAGNTTYILRLYLHDKYYVSGPDDLRFELDLLDHLAAEGVGVATAVARRNGDRLGSAQAPEGVRHYALFRYAPGVAVASPTEAQSWALGEELARIHLAADRFRSRYPRHSLGLAALIDAALERLAPYLASNPDDLRYVRETAEQVRSRLSSMQTSPGGWGIIHGDPHPGNREYPHRAAFLEGYQAVRPLSADELDALPALRRARVIWDAGDVMTMASIWGEIACKKLVTNMVTELRQLDGES
jgi:Ser/Thr protein kinase RdoA (MazF antagonist)